MAYIALSRFTKGSGNVEALVWFCDLISHGPNKPYHATYLREKLIGKVGLWPIYLERRKINDLINRSYRTAFNRHYREHYNDWKLNPVPFAPLPNRIRHYPTCTIRYCPKKIGLVITLDLDASILLVQGNSYDRVLDFCKKIPNVMTPIFVNTDKLLTVDEACNFRLSLGDLSNLLQSRILAL
jgi:hypothetical protein